MVASDHNVNILIQQSIEDDKIFFYLGDTNSTKVPLSAFSKMLYLKGFNLKKTDGFYFIEQIVKPEVKPVENVFQTVALKNPVFVDVQNLLNTYEINATYIASNNSISFSAPPKRLNEILTSIRAIDVPQSQVQFKITVLETSMDALKDRGANVSAYLQTTNETSKYFLNLITMPYTATTNVTDNSKSGFYGVLKFLDENGYTKIKNSPIVTARNQTEVSFSSVKNIPYKAGTSSYSNASTSSTTSYAYKDVGLKVIIKPIIIDNMVNFDLTLTIEDLLSITNDTPTTSKKELKSTYSLQRGDMLILSGINKETVSDSSYSVPVLRSIYLLGELFKYNSTSTATSILTMTIEVL
jgi:general secretion pathway protein D